MSRCLCTGDWQLGVATVDLDDQEQVAHRIADVAIEERVDAVLHGGDLFEGPNVTDAARRAFRRPLARLRHAGIPVVVILGNGRHDAAQRHVNALDWLEDVPGVTVSTTPELLDVAGVPVVTLPWVSRGWVAAQLGFDTPVDELHQLMAEQLITVARGLHPGVSPSVLLLHWDISGAAYPSGLPVDEARVPILPLDELEALGYTAVVASHVHKPQLLSTGALSVNGNGSHVVEQPCRVFYTGSPMVLNHGEAGCDHGVWILDTADPDGLRFVEIESRRWVTLDYDFTDEITTAELSELSGMAAPFPEGAIVRLRYKATPEQARRLNIAGIKQALLDAGAHRVAPEPTIVREQRVRLEGLDHTLGEREAFERWLEHSHDGMTVERRRVICDHFHRLLENTA